MASHPRALRHAGRQSGAVCRQLRVHGFEHACPSLAHGPWGRHGSARLPPRPLHRGHAHWQSGDITCARDLRGAAVACEDTRITGGLMQHLA
jgi:hypothetical protein